MNADQVHPSSGADSMVRNSDLERLIAAAPGLLIATECALALGIDPDKGREVLERHGFKWDDDTSPYSPTYRADKFVTELCRAAISRATQPTKEQQHGS